MAAPSDQPLIGALDIGSSKVSALICTSDPDGRQTSGRLRTHCM